jgi:hypothetical protein
MDRLNFEDTIFILNMRIRMIRDTLRLTPPPELFLGKSLDDLAFIDSALETLVRSFTESNSQYDRSVEFDYISDTEWQLSQLLTEFSLESSPFSAQAFPETMEKITALRASSNVRRKTLEETSVPLEIAHAEPVVSSAELTGLLGSV